VDRGVQGVELRLVCRQNSSNFRNASRSCVCVLQLLLGRVSAVRWCCFLVPLLHRLRQSGSFQKYLCSEDTSHLLQLFLFVFADMHFKRVRTLGNALFCAFLEAADLLLLLHISASVVP